jgi:intraflagellar transport protein 140
MSAKIAPTCFFVGGEAGTVLYADDMKHCHEVQSLSAAVDSMLYYEEKNRLVIITRSLLMIQLEVGSSGLITPIMKVKLSVAGDGSVVNVVWAGPGLLATSSGEKMLRFWDLAGDENYVLGLSTAGPSIAHNDRLTTIAFNPNKRVLTGGTRNGKVVMWKFVGFQGSASKKDKSGKPQKTSAANWEPMVPITMAGAIKNLSWGPSANLLAVSMPGHQHGPSILNETVLHRKLFEDTAAIQLTSERISIETSNGPVRTLDCGVRVKGLAMDSTHVVVWNGKKAEVFQHSSSTMQRVSTFPTVSTNMCICGESLYRTGAAQIEVCNLSGNVKDQIAFTEQEGEPVLLDLNGKFLVVGTANGRLKIFDVSRRVPTPIGTGGKFEETETGAPIGQMRSIRINADGTRVSILSEHVSGGQMKMTEPDSRLHVYNSDMDTVVNYEFGPTRYPVSHSWDPVEPKLLVCETLKLKTEVDSKEKISDKAPKIPPKSPTKEAASESKQSEEEITRVKQLAEERSAEKKKTDVATNDEVEITTLFATSDYGLLMQDSFELDANLEAILGLKVPRLYFMTKMTDETAAHATAASRLKSRVMRDFVGLETVDDATRAALLDFSYFLTVGNMDEAYKAVKLIKNPSVWENMAHMCVKTKRLDVAEVCLGNMGHARGARAVRESKKESEVEACVAMVAIQLGLLDDAVRLYKECGRFDLLNKLYQAAGQWDRALEIANEKDRIHLRTTHYQYAKHLESLGDTANAIKNYEKSETHRKEVPRLLFDAQYVDDLEGYINKVGDKELLKWWAQYCESNGYFDKASHFYQRAEDNLSLVRVACYGRDFTKAAEIVRETNSSAAAYHLARQHEGAGNVSEAITYFSRAGRYNHAIRLAKEHGLDTELMSFALQSTKAQMVDVAGYFEKKTENEKAVQLYQKGGEIAKALDLCFRAQLFDVLRTIADDLGADTSPETLGRCAEFFMDHGQYEKAAHLYVTAKRYDEALDLCMAHKINITEEMAERMTLAKTDDANHNAVRLALLEKLAKCCKKQGSFHLATKKYTQAGDKLKAMKCLLKSGDTEKVIFFAGVSRDQKIYTLAANYLQNLDWHNDPEIMKAIINFYTKAKEFERLSGFYDACAQVEIDEYRDYEKALGALKEAVKYKIKAKVQNKDEQLASLHQRIGLVELFVQARRLVKTDPAEMVKICHQLLDRPDVETAIRVGDGFALLIEFYYAQRNFEQAYRLIEKMRERHIILNPYLDQEMINTIYQAVGVAIEGEGGAADAAGDDVAEDDMEEEISEGEDENPAFKRK